MAVVLVRRHRSTISSVHPWCLCRSLAHHFSVQLIGPLPLPDSRQGKHYILVVYDYATSTQKQSLCDPMMLSTLQKSWWRGLFGLAFPRKFWPTRGAILHLNCLLSCTACYNLNKSLPSTDGQPCWTFQQDTQVDVTEAAIDESVVSHVLSTIDKIMTDLVQQHMRQAQESRNFGMTKELTSENSLLVHSSQRVAHCLNGHVHVPKYVSTHLHLDQPIKHTFRCSRILFLVINSLTGNIQVVSSCAPTLKA